METIRKQDRKLEVKKQIAQHWINIFGERSTNGILLHPEFYAALAEIAKDGKTLSSVRLGHWLKKVQGQIIPALKDPDNPKGEKLLNQRFERADDPNRSGAALWALKAKPLKNQESLAEDADVADVVTTPARATVKGQ